MKRISVLVLAAALAAVGCSSKKEPPTKMTAGTPAYQLAKDLAAVVPALNPETNPVVVTSKTFEITAGEVLQWLIDTKGQQVQALKGQDAPRIKAVVERAGVQLGERKLLYEAAVAAGKLPTPEDVRKTLEAQYSKAGGEAQYLGVLKANGISLDSVKRSLTEDLAIRNWLEGRLTANIRVTEDELEKAYREDKTATVRHILLLTQGKSDAEKVAIRKKMEDILARAVKGEDFATLAREFSEDPGSKANGGLYEDFGHGKMVKPFEDAAFSVPVGRISGIVETAYGYHILKVESRKKETLPFDQVKAQLEAQLKQQKENAAFEEILTGLKDKAAFRVVLLK